MEIVKSIILLGAMGLIFGAVLAYASKKFAVEIDERVEKIIEVLPGAMPKVIHRLCAKIKVPVIAGGLITDKESVMGALTAGATAVSSTNHKVWNL